MTSAHSLKVRFDSYAIFVSLHNSERILVAGGQLETSYGHSTTTEIIEVGDTIGDFTSDPSLIHDMPGGHTGGFSAKIGEYIFICSGYNDAGQTSTCSQFNTNTESWTRPNFNMQSPLSYGGSVVLPNGTWIIIGGWNDYAEYQSSTMIFKDGAFSPGPSMPAERAGVCAVLVNYTHISVTGGRADAAGAFSSSYLLDVTKGVWKIMPDMIGPRNRHSCGIVTDDQRDIEVSNITNMALTMELHLVMWSLF